MNKKYILIIEDEFKDYLLIGDAVREANLPFELLPKEKDFADFILKVVKRKDVTDIVDAISFYFEEYRENIVAVVCDLFLTQDSANLGHKAILSIRKYVQVDGLSFYLKYIPIFAYTKSRDENRCEAIKAGATHLLEKKEEQGAKELVMVIDSTLFALSQYATYADLLKNAKEDYYDSLIKSQQAVVETINDFKLVLEGPMDQFNQQLSLVLEFLLNGMSQSQRERFLEIYENDLSDFLSDRAQCDLKKSEFDKWKEAFSEINKSGGFSESVKAILEILEISDITNSAKGKLLAAAVKGLFGVMSSRS